VDLWFCKTTRKLVVEVPSIAAVLSLSPKFADLTAIDFVGTESIDVRGVIVTTQGSEQLDDKQSTLASFDFVSR